MEKLATESTRLRQDFVGQAENAEFIKFHHEGTKKLDADYVSYCVYRRGKFCHKDAKARIYLTAD